jgi:glycosyltransferase involved in cell wall biosynthesis
LEKPNVVAVIPALNESKTVGQIVEDAKKYVNQVIVVDDGSWDSTGALSKIAGAKVLRHSIPTGAGGAMFAGIEASKLYDPDVVVTLDADGQHFPEDIPKVIAPIIEKVADCVVGYRFSTMKQVKLTLYKRLLNMVASRTASWLSGTELRDSETGFRAYNKVALNALDFTSMDYGWATDSLITLSRKKIRFIEVPVKTVWGIPTREGQKRRGLVYGVKVLFRFLWRHV